MYFGFDAIINGIVFLIPLFYFCDIIFFSCFLAHISGLCRDALLPVAQHCLTFMLMTPQMATWLVSKTPSSTFTIAHWTLPPESHRHLEFISSGGNSLINLQIFSYFIYIFMFCYLKIALPTLLPKPELWKLILTFLPSFLFYILRSVQSLGGVQLFVTPWIAAHQASLSITNSWSSLRLMSIESVMPSSHLILRRPLLLLPPIPPSIRVFSNESTLHTRWPKYWSFSCSIIPSKEIPGLIYFRMDWLGLLAVQGTLKSLLQHHSSKASILRHSVQLSHPYMTLEKP